MSTGALVVWDMDGTLVDSTSVVPDAFFATIRELQGSTIDREEVIAAYSRGVPEVILEYFLNRPITATDADRFYKRIERAKVNAYPDVTVALEQLRRRGLPVAVFTGASTRSATALLESAGIHVDVLVGGEDVKPKPSGEGLSRIASDLGREARELIYVGDSPTDMMAAHDAGAFAAAAAWGHLHDSNTPADAVFASPLAVLPLL